MLEFESVELKKVGGKCGMRDHQWGAVELRFRESENDHIRAAVLHVLLPRRPDATVLELEEAARNGAISILEAALAELRGSSLAELRDREYAAEDRQREEDQRQLEELQNWKPEPLPR